MNKHKIEEHFYHNMATACAGSVVEFLKPRKYLEKLESIPLEQRTTNEKLNELGLTNIINDNKIYVLFIRD